MYKSIKTKTRITVIALIMAIALVFTMIPQPASANEEPSGYLNGSIKWMVEHPGSDGTLVISGFGDMPDWTFEEAAVAPWRNYGFRQILILDGVNSIGDCSFCDLRDVRGVIMAQTVSEIGNYAFSGCGTNFDGTSTLEVDIPPTLKSIGEEAFSGSAIREIWLPPSVKTIPKHAFSGSYLEKVEFSKQTEIDDFAFHGCWNLEEVSLPDTLEKLGGCAFGGTRIKELILPEGLTTLGSTYEDPEFGGVYEYAGILDMDYLDTIIIPASLKNFYGGDMSFAGCDNLTTVGFKGTAEQWAEFSANFDPINVPENMNVICGYETKDVKDVHLSVDSFVYNGKAKKITLKDSDGNVLVEGEDYTSEIYKGGNDTVAPINAGQYMMIVRGINKYTGTLDVFFVIDKAKNPLKVKGKTATVKFKKSKKQTIKTTKVVKFVNKGKGTLSYKKVSVSYKKAKSVKLSKKALKKYKKSLAKKIKVDAKTGKVTITKGTKKGVYTVKAKIKAKGTTNYKMSTWQAVTLKVRVK